MWVEAGVDLLSIDEVAQRLGVHYMTVYRYVRIGRLPAERRHGRWQIDPAHVDSLTSGSARSVGRAGLTPAVDRLVDRLVSGDGPGAWSIVETALLSGTPTDVHVELLGPALRSVGEGWQEGRLSIADEHRATVLALGIVGRLGPLFARRGRPRPGSVLLAGAEGDHHAIPLLMLGDVLRGAGFGVVQLGADVPVPTLVAMAAPADLAAVGLSASTDEGAANLERAIAELRRHAPGVPLLAGGPAIASEKSALRLGADGWAPEAASAVEAVTALARPR